MGLSAKRAPTEKNGQNKKKVPAEQKIGSGTKIVEQKLV